MLVANTTPDSVKQVHYLAAAPKAPRISEAATRLADQTRDAGWTHEDHLAAVLEREVSDAPPPARSPGIMSAGFSAIQLSSRPRSVAELGRGRLELASWDADIRRGSSARCDVVVW